MHARFPVHSAEEAGRHIETYKVFESKSAELLMEKSEEDVFGKACQFNP